MDGFAPYLLGLQNVPQIKPSLHSRTQLQLKYSPNQPGQDTDVPPQPTTYLGFQLEQKTPNIQM